MGLIENMNKPAPRWFRKSKKAILVLVVALNAMIANWGIHDPLLVSRIQLWCTIGIGAIMEALDIVLTNGEEYTSGNPDVSKEQENKNNQI